MDILRVNSIECEVLQILPLQGNPEQKSKWLYLNGILILNIQWVLGSKWANNPVTILIPVSKFADRARSEIERSL